MKECPFSPKEEQLLKQSLAPIDRAQLADCQGVITILKGNRTTSYWHMFIYALMGVMAGALGFAFLLVGRSKGDAGWMVSGALMFGLALPACRWFMAAKRESVTLTDRIKEFEELETGIKNNVSYTHS
jgi:hypothetical protein